MHLKRFLITVCMVIFLGLICWLIIKAIKPEILPKGAPIPELKYFDAKGVQILKPDSAKNTIVIFFHLECDHCMYQMDQFNSHLDEFININLIFLTTDSKQLKNNNIEQWHNITGAKNVQWGIVDKDEFKQSFGSIATPTMFLFNKSGQLSDKFRGEVKLERIIKNLGGPERQD